MIFPACTSCRTLLNPQSNTEKGASVFFFFRPLLAKKSSHRRWHLFLSPCRTLRALASFQLSYRPTPQQTDGGEFQSKHAMRRTSSSEYFDHYGRLNARRDDLRPNSGRAASFEMFQEPHLFPSVFHRSGTESARVGKKPTESDFSGIVPVNTQQQKNKTKQENKTKKTNSHW